MCQYEPSPYKEVITSGPTVQCKFITYTINTILEWQLHNIPGTRYVCMCVYCMCVCVYVYLVLGIVGGLGTSIILWV